MIAIVEKSGEIVLMADEHAVDFTRGAAFAASSVMRLHTVYCGSSDGLRITIGDRHFKTVRNHERRGIEEIPGNLR